MRFVSLCKYSTVRNAHFWRLGENYPRISRARAKISDRPNRPKGGLALTMSPKVLKCFSDGDIICYPRIPFRRRLQCYSTFGGIAKARGH